MKTRSELLDKNDCLLFLIDIQRSMLNPCVDAELLQKHVSVLIDIAQIIGIPIIFTEQNPVKLGKFLPELTEKVVDPVVLGKNEFGSFENERIRDAVMETGRKTIIMAGIEAHICISQTGLQGIQRGYRIHAVSDAISSSSETNRKIGLLRLEKAGAVISSVEMIIFELLKSAGTSEFRQALPIIKMR